MILGVTGGIAAGKSMVTEVFRSLGAVVVSADELAREVVEPGSAALQQLIGRFGTGILREDGSLDRKALAALIFSDTEARLALNRIIHPAIAVLSEERLQALARQGEPLIIYEAPLLFEAGAEGRVDAVLVVTVEDKLQRQRLMDRDGISETEAKARIAAQMSQAEKAARADFVIDNSGTREETEARIRTLFQRLTGHSGPPPGRGESRP
jgi:dephospho-CoA kinase